jgi:hypothetical protein
VADFETTYNAFLGRPALTKFMAIPHYAYLVLKMPRPRGVISIIGDAKQAYECGKESCKMADRLTTSVELRKLKESLVESPPDPVMPNSKTSKMFIVDVTYASLQVHKIVNVALHWEYSLGIVFIFSQERKGLYHI